MKHGLSVKWAMVVCLWIMGQGFGASQDGWISLFDGKTLDGWKASENTGSFTVQDGVIVAHGSRSHLFYTGPVENAIFTDFELKVEVKTSTNSNGGIYFHTAYQQDGWPDKGFEVQVNNSYNADPRKTGSLYQVNDITTAMAKDDVWFTEYILVQGNQVIVLVDGKLAVNWTQSGTTPPVPNSPGRVLGQGTFALQGHDPGSTVCYRNIQVRPLPVIDFPLVDYHVHLKGGLTLEAAVANAKKLGLKYGIAQNCGLGFPVTDDAGLLKFLNDMTGQPVFKAMQAEGREWVTMFTVDAIAKADYVFTDAMTFTDDKARRMRLWMPDEVFVDEPQAFMDMLVGKIVGVMREPIDIYVNPTFLPEVIEDQYDTLWTDARMDLVIAAAAQYKVAIEINARYRIPSKRFIQKAKAAGVKFACGTNNTDQHLGNLEYCRRMIRECKLTEADFFVPKPQGQKRIDGLRPR